MSEKTSTTSTQLEEKTIVDADIHINIMNTANETEAMKSFADYLPQPYADYVRAPDNSYPDQGWSKTLGGKKNTVVADVTSPEIIRQELCEKFGVDHPIINPLVRPDYVPRTDRGIAEMRAGNDYLIEQFLDVDDDLRGLACLATRKPSEAAEEIDRVAKEDGIVGVFFAIGDNYQKPIGDPSHDIIFESLVDNNLNPVFHTGRLYDRVPILREMESFFALHSLNSFWNGMLTMTSLIENAVPEKFPELDLIMIELGLTWVPSMMSRLNREHGQWSSDVPLLNKTPEEYIRDSFYFGTQPIGELNDPSHLRSIIEIVGADNLMFTSDFPHHDFDHPDTIYKLFEWTSEETRNNIFKDNANEVFDLGL